MPTMIRVALVLCTLALSGVALADHGRGDDDDEHERRRQAPAETQAPAAARVADAPGVADRYRAECGSCHLAYPPGLLPAASWQRLLDGLDAHFGQNAELDAPTRTLLAGWLSKHAAESGENKRGQKILRSLGGEAPLRLSTTPYIVRKHRELSPAVLARPAVGSLANCTACHGEGAARGDFEEDRVRIPRGG